MKPKKKKPEPISKSVRKRLAMQHPDWTWKANPCKKCKRVFCPCKGQQSGDKV